MNKKNITLLSCILLLLILFEVFSISIFPFKEYYTAQKEGSSFETLLGALGGFRNFLAAILWLKVDNYHHEAEWADSPELQKGKDILVLIRLITWLDPHFVEAYVVGGWELIMIGKKEEGLEFLKEALERNPENYFIVKELAFEYLFSLKKYQQAVKYAQLGLEYVHIDVKPFDEIEPMKRFSVVSEDMYEKEVKNMHLILGIANDSLKNYQEAYSHYKIVQESLSSDSKIQKRIEYLINNQLVR